MKFWQYLKMELIMTLKQSPMLLLTLVLSPFILSFYMALMTGSAFDVQPEPPEISIYYDNQSNHAKAKSLDQVVERLEEQKVFQLEEKAEDAEFIVTVNPQFGEMRQGEAVLVQYGKSNSKSGANGVRETFSTVIGQINQFQVVENAIEEGKLTPTQAQTIVEKVESASQQLNTAVKVKESHHSLTSNQHYSLTNVGYLYMIILISIFTANVKPEFNGIRKRMDLLPIKLSEKTIFSTMSSALIYTIFSAAYILLWKITDSSTFQGPFYLYVGLSLLYSFAVAAIGHCLSEWVTEKWLPLVNGIFPLVWMIFSGFIPLDRMTSIEIFKKLPNNLIEVVFVQPLRDIYYHQSLQPSLLALGALIVVALIAMSVKIIILKQREV